MGSISCWKAGKKLCWRIAETAVIQRVFPFLVIVRNFRMKEKLFDPGVVYEISVSVRAMNFRSALFFSYEGNRYKIKYLQSSMFLPCFLLYFKYAWNIFRGTFFRLLAFSMVLPDKMLICMYSDTAISLSTSCLLLFSKLFEVALQSIQSCRNSSCTKYTLFVFFICYTRC